MRKSIRSVMCRSLILLHMWRNFRYLHGQNCHAKKSEISQRQIFYPFDKYEIWEHSGSILKALWNLGALWEHSGHTMGALCEYYGVTLGALWEHNGHTMVLWYYGTTLGALWDYSGSTMGLLWEHKVHTMGALWEYYGSTMGALNSWVMCRPRAGQLQSCARPKMFL